MESECSVFEHGLNKRRSNVTEEHKAQEFFVHMNSPPIASAERLIKASLNRHFGRDWHFFTNDPQKKSVVINRLNSTKAKLPFVREVNMRTLIVVLCSRYIYHISIEQILVEQIWKLFWEEPYSRYWCSRTTR